jgi:hypothetical protein
MYRLKFYGFQDELNDKIVLFLSQINISEIKTNIVFVQVLEDNEKERLKIRKIINTNREPFFIFSNNKDIAAMAWEIGADYFINFSKENWKSQLKKAIEQRFCKNLYSDNRKICFNSQKRVDCLMPEDIIFIIACGNYCEIHLSDRDSITITKQIGQVEKMLNPYDYLERFGKSTIINLNRIKSIKDKTIEFSNKKQLNFPKYSNSFAYLKKRVIWK